jgi:peptidoglycan/LPS O-acetylase OafA/YrhL
MVHNKELDGLRGLAALSVVLTHFVAAFLPATLYRHYPGVFPEPSPGSLEAYLSYPLLSVFYGGLLPVVIFFVLSGYVLALPYWSGNRHLLLRRFWTRYIRLNIPIAAAILISFSILSLGLYFNEPASRESQSYWLSLWFKPENPDYLDLFKQMLWGGISGQLKYDPPLWTLAIELFGSMILLGYFALKPPLKNFLSILSFAVGLVVLTMVLINFFQNTWLFFLSIILGGYLPPLKLNKKLLVAAIFFVGFYFGAYVVNGNGYGILPNPTFLNAQQFYTVLGAVLIVFAVANGLGSWLLSSSICQWLGKVSFSVYLLHFIILCSLASYVDTVFSEETWALPLVLTCYLVSCYVAAAIFRLVDVAAIYVSASIGRLLFPNPL